MSSLLKISGVLLICATACTFNESEVEPNGTSGDGTSTNGTGTVGSDAGTSSSGTGGSGTASAGTAGDASGSGTMGSGSGGPDVIDPIPLARYRLAQNPGANIPTEIIDDAPMPLNLPLNVIQNSPRFMIDGDGNTYLQYEETTSPDTGGARLPIAGTKLAPIHGAKKNNIGRKIHDSWMC